MTGTEVNRALKAALATLGLLLSAVCVFVLLGLVPANTELGSMLRAGGGGLLSGVTLAWGAYLVRTFRRNR
ncbi:hypothetical protein [Kitasatospora sp. SUK 42]|uniref:hypothetical protein n=1 Tax=Kitasatospora sp. SUK 42 TaxID=1588882 RepID=UPI0018CA9542|nr:hypothetical protein [Kitasatospora sp. SUK 42]MBV2151541.1 hypothetical protein [Kitasatospora sp. SUK 42]